MQIPTKKVDPHDRFIRGLTSQQVEHNTAINTAQIFILPPEREPAWKLFLAKFDDPVIQIFSDRSNFGDRCGVVGGLY